MKFWTSCLFALVGGAVFAAPLTSQFNYQGKLEAGGAPANGAYDLRFEPFGAAGGGSALGSAVVVENVDVVDGVFTTTIDFGTGFFVGDRVFLSVGVREGASAGAFTTLSPRQEITAT
ncbi:MAG TPA: hypothetical protein VJ724_04230, partial [Tahibacter sp.]|nr:hypothetical protein [Tahibacter sp.]